MDDPRDYIECTECGHDLWSAHNPKGCHLEGCTCTIGWTRDAKRALARDMRNGY